MRLDKFIGQCTDHSRTQIHQAIKAGRIVVDGIIATKADLKLNGREIVLMDNQPVALTPLRYLMLHKPAGYLCANSDAQHPVVLDLLDLPQKQGLQIVGRLDIDTTGLVLLTDDGQWNHRITSPRHECQKIYRVHTADVIDNEVIALFAQGVQLHGEKALTRPAHLELAGPCEARLSIHEGKYHQVKRMFAATGNRVIGLHREAIGAIQLDATLAEGGYRHLTQQEIESIT